MDSNRNGSAYRADAPAKINLFLEVLGKRSDGFHEIETLMVAVSLRDTLLFRPTNDGTVCLSCRWVSGMEAKFINHHRSATDPTLSQSLGTLPTAADNLVLQAVETLRQEAGVAAGAKIEVLKRVPAAAGLGGASSDAAAALRLANRAWGVGWRQEQLTRLAEQIGSDVPFFLGRQLGLCRGRGEQIRPVASKTRLHVVLVRPPVGLSTAKVYERCQPAAKPRSVGPLMTALHGGDLVDVGRHLFNRLEVAAERLTPWVERLRDEFAKLGLVGSQMSGSGSSFFGLCRHRRQARRAASRLAGGARGAGLCCLVRSAALPPLRCFDLKGNASWKSPKFASS